LPDAGTTYENVCNVIEYSPNKYFANQKYQKERQKPNMNAPFINLT
jgi:hypothetical protein